MFIIIITMLTETSVALYRKVTRARGGWRLWNAVVDGPLAKEGGRGLYQVIVLKKKLIS